MTKAQRKDTSHFDPSLYYWYCRNCGPVEGNQVDADQICPTCGEERAKIRKRKMDDMRKSS